MKRQRLAGRRKAVGLSQERLAEAVGVDRTTVVRWERGDTEPQPWHRRRLAEALAISLDLLDELLTTTAPHPTALAATTAVAQYLPPMNARHGIEDDLIAMHSFRLVDRQVGGAHLYSAVTTYLQHAIGPRMFGQVHNTDTDSLLIAAAGLTEMAGWMAHDAGRADLAEQHFQRALGLASAGQDHQLGAHVLASLSHLAHHARRPKRATAYARQGRERLAQRQPHSGVEARLLAMEARGHAARHDEEACTRNLRLAEQALDGPPREPRSPWASDFDHASLAAEAARCFKSLGLLVSAKTYSERVVAERSADRTRSRAFAQLMLVDVLVAQGQAEEACVVAQRVVESTRTLSSYLIIEELHRASVALAHHRRVPEVGAFVRSLNGELQRRRSLWWFAASNTATEGGAGNR